MKAKYKFLILISVIMVNIAAITCGVSAAFIKSGKVSVNDSGVVIAEAGKYKSIDYSFLNTFVFGDEADSKVQLTFNTAAELMKSTDVRLKEGRYIRTKGYYISGDKGGASYVISSVKGNYGSIELQNGLYANIVTDTYSYAGEKWAVISVKQYGAYGNGLNVEQDSINSAIKAAGEIVGTGGVTRALVYIPQGEYKVTNQLFVDVDKVNIMGAGDKSVIFTDNDYRADEDYYEFFIMVQGADNLYMSDFRVEAREVDVYKYMRQMILSDCTNVYINNVDMIVPQEAWSGFYYEDKQYTNLTLYSGNRNITVDGCYMEQMSGTYRGANLGILDFWQRGEENITIMNCEFHDNARDEQIGIFSLSNSSISYIKNVDFINNVMYTYKPPHIDLYGNRQMCFTVAYSDSPNVSDIRIAGNHFIGEVDSKHMTFGNVKNCVVEDNIFEIYSSYGVTGYLFDSSNGDAANIVIQNNEIFLSGRDNLEQGKAALSIGYLTFKNNRVVSEAQLYGISDKNGVYSGNEFIGISYIGDFGCPTEFNSNEIIAYGGLGKCMNYSSADFAGRIVNCNNNTITNYLYKNEDNNNPFAALNSVSNCTFDTFSFCNNTYVCPNFRYLETSRNNAYNHILYFKQSTGTVKKIIVKNNNLIGAKGVFTWGDVSATTITNEGNTYNDFTYNGAAIKSENIKIKYNGNEVTDITIYGDTVNLSAVTTKSVDWVSSVEAIATVNNGVVKRQQYGTVYIYAVPKDGVSEPARCCIHFVKQKATAIELDTDKITMQPGYVHDVSYKVLPYNDSSQKLKWTSSDSSVASVDEYGVINAIAAGSATITCTTTDGSNLTKTIKVTVEKLTVKRINLNYNWKYFDTQSGTVKLSADSYTPDNAVNKTVGKWESTAPSVATVDSSGLVTIKGGGVTYIRAYTSDNKYYSECVILVKPDTIKQLSVQDIGKDNITLSWEPLDNVYGYNVYRYNNSTGAWDKINATQDNTFRDIGLTPGTEYKYCVKGYIARWDSSGRIEYVGDTGNIVNALTYTFQPVNGINILSETISTGVGDKVNVQAKLSPYNCTYKDLIWTVGNTSIAMVEFESSNSTLKVVVKGVSAGVTTLTAKSKDAVGFSVTVPVVILDAERPKAVTLEPKYKDMTIKWEPIADEADIDGYVVYRTSSIEYSPVKYISKSALKTSTDSSGNKCYVYTDTGLSQNVNYGYKVAPYIEHNGMKYAGSLSYEKRAMLLPYTDVDSIYAEEEYVISIGETKKIYAMVDTEKGMLPDFVWQMDDTSVAGVYPLESLTTKDCAYANIKGVAAGITRLNIIADDSTGYFIMPKIIVLPNKVSDIKANVSSDSVTLTWNKAEGADGYIIYLYREDGDAYIQQYQTTGTGITITGLLPSTAYHYEICAYLEDSEKLYEGAKSSRKALTTAATAGVQENPNEESETKADKDSEVSDEKTTSDDSDKITESEGVASDNNISEDGMENGSDDAQDELTVNGGSDHDKSQGGTAGDSEGVSSNEAENDNTSVKGNDSTPWRWIIVVISGGVVGVIIFTVIKEQKRKKDKQEN